MPADQPGAYPLLKTITVRLYTEAGEQPPEIRQELVLSALAAALMVLNDGVSFAWTVRPAHGSEPLLYDLTPLSENPVSVKDAWEVTHALRSEPQVAAAEPVFVTPQPDPAAPAHDQAMAPRLADPHDNGRYKL